MVFLLVKVLQMTPLLDFLCTIYAKEGISWCHPTNKVQQVSLVVAPLASADAPIRADLLNMKSHNSKYASNTCEQKTEKIAFTAEKLAKRTEGKRIQRRRGFIFRRACTTSRRTTFEEARTRGLSTKKSCERSEGTIIVRKST